MLQAENYRRLYTGGARTYPEAVRVFDQAYGLHLKPQTIRTAKVQGEAMRNSYDAAHTHDHLLELIRNAELLLARRWSLREEVDWSQLVDFISLHDVGRSRVPATPITLFSSQLLEGVFAPIVARNFMKEQWKHVDETLLGIIARHPYHAGHPKRGIGSFSSTEKLAVDVDGLAVLSPRRVDTIYQHIQNSFFGMSLRPFHGFLSRLFDGYTDFSFFYPEAEEIAHTWRAEADMYIKEKFLRKGR